MIYYITLLGYHVSVFMTSTFLDIMYIVTILAISAKLWYKVIIQAWIAFSISEKKNPVKIIALVCDEFHERTDRMHYKAIGISYSLNQYIELKA